MPKQKFKLTAVLTAVFLTPLLSACTKPVAKEDAAKSTEAKVASSAGSAVPQVDVATQPNTLPEKDASAKEVCERFLGLLAQGERSLAEQLLTQRALKLTVAVALSWTPWVALIPD